MNEQTGMLRPLALAMMMSFGGLAIAQAPAVTPKEPVAARPATATAMRADGNRAERDWERRHRASKIIGTNVRNRQGEKIGDVEDIVLDRNGTVAYAVVSTGGFLGIGDRLHAIPWKALQPVANEDHLVLDIDRKRLQAAPGFPANTWPNFNDEKWNADNRRAYPVPATR
ncbi:MAG: PRC-barrel domain-containing protein [bacterium]|jgi:sporulation protein YlmC with PRC-barrel domain|nr:PRC-barrel domain-containing protein [Betaproteobacteria bacterium]